MKFAKRIQINLSEKQFEDAKIQAENKGKKVSEYVRDLLVKDKKHETSN